MYFSVGLCSIEVWGKIRTCVQWEFIRGWQTSRNKGRCSYEAGAFREDPGPRKRPILQCATEVRVASSESLRGSLIVNNADECMRRVTQKSTPLYMKYLPIKNLLEQKWLPSHHFTFLAGLFLACYKSLFVFMWQKAFRRRCWLSLNMDTANAQAISTPSLPRNNSFRQCFHTTEWSDSVALCVYLSKHFLM